MSRGSCCAPCFAVGPPAMFWPHSMSWAPALRAGAWAPSPAPLFGMLWGSGKPRGGWWGGCRGVSAHMGPSAPACSPPSLQHIPSLTRFLPPIPFFRRCVASAAVSCPSSCFVAPAILTTRLTIYPDGAGLLLCAWHAFSICKFCAEAERTEPNKLCELSRALGVLASVGVQAPQVPAPAPAPAITLLYSQRGVSVLPSPALSLAPVTPSDLALLALAQLQ